MRKNRRFRKIAAVSLLAVTFVLTPRARALFGLGDIVIDPTAIAKLAQQISQYQQMLSQYQSMLTTANNTFNMWKQNFIALGSKQTWKTFGLSLMNDSTQNLYGETANWSTAINYGGSAIPQAWRSATLPVTNPGAFLSSETLGASAHLPALASIEMTDGTAQDSMNTLASYRQQQTENAAALNQLEQTALSQDPNSNTLVAQQNIANAALMQQIRVMQANGTINAALLQQQLVANTYQRNLAAETINTYAVLAQHQANDNVYSTGWAQSLSNYQPQ
jgi:hypothetical protein